MKRLLLLLLIAITAMSCKKSFLVCYICKNTVIIDSGGKKNYIILNDYTKCNVEKSEIDKYQAAHNKIDTVAPGYIIDTSSLCGSE